MTKQTLIVLASLGASAGCPGPAENPARLWLAPDMMETRVKLIDHEPNPF